MHVVRRQRFDGGKFPQSEPPVASSALTHQAWSSASTSTQAAAAVGSPLCFEWRKTMAAVGSPLRIAMSTRAVLL